LEEEVLDNPTPNTARQIHHLKREMIFLRKVAWPLREVVAGLSREDIELFSPETRLHLRDVYDHVVQVIDSIETFREMLAGLLEIYLSTVSNKRQKYYASRITYHQIKMVLLGRCLK
jgi:magnesium transporter